MGNTPAKDAEQIPHKPTLKGDAKLGSVGRPHDGIEVRIVRDDGTDATTNEPGEIWARSPFVMRGYASDARELDTRLDSDGFLRTGDIGHLDDDGFLWIDGRVSDAINRGGLKVYPGDVEEVLREDPSVADVCVAGVPARRVGEMPWAWVVLAPGAALDAGALQQRCREKLAPYAVPAGFDQQTKRLRRSFDAHHKFGAGGYPAEDLRLSHF